MPARLRRSFFQRDPVTCARELIGCELRWHECAGIIAETEAYAAVGDEACHTFMRPSTRAFVAAHRAGTAYVYLNYGVHWMLNVVIKAPAGDGFVLIRALEPTRGFEAMSARRNPKTKIQIPKSFCSGPGKLAQALGVNGTHHGIDLCAPGPIGFYAAREPVRVETCVRIGISRAIDLPWRFLLKNSPHVSRRKRG